MSRTVQMTIPTYLENRRALRDLCPKAISGARVTLQQFADHVGARSLTKISPNLVSSWLAKMEHLALATVRVRLSAVKTFFAWCIRKGYCHRNPADGFKV